VASRDLRQPLHALNLVAQLRSETDRRSEPLAARIEAAIDNMNGLFNGLPISELDAGAMKPSISDFPIASILKHGEHVAATAREKGSI
jgi:signal transduction histidine kinase